MDNNEHCTSFAMDTAYNKIVRRMTDDGEYLHCQTCGKQWYIEDFEKESSSIRDLPLFNCSILGSEIKIPVKHQINLLMSFSCHVELKLKANCCISRSSTTSMLA